MVSGVSSSDDQRRINNNQNSNAQGSNSGAQSSTSSQSSPATTTAPSAYHPKKNDEEAKKAEKERNLKLLTENPAQPDTSESKEAKDSTTSTEGQTKLEKEDSTSKKPEESGVTQPSMSGKPPAALSDRKSTDGKKEASSPETAASEQSIRDYEAQARKIEEQGKGKKLTDEERMQVHQLRSQAYGMKSELQTQRASQGGEQSAHLQEEAAKNKAKAQEHADKYNQLKAAKDEHDVRSQIAADFNRTIAQSRSNLATAAKEDGWLGQTWDAMKSVGRVGGWILDSGRSLLGTEQQFGGKLDKLLKMTQATGKTDGSFEAAFKDLTGREYNSQEAKQLYAQRDQFIATRAQAAALEACQAKMPELDKALKDKDYKKYDELFRQITGLDVDSASMSDLPAAHDKFKQSLSEHIQKTLPGLQQKAQNQEAQFKQDYAKYFNVNENDQLVDNYIQSQKNGVNGIILTAATAATIATGGTGLLAAAAGAGIGAGVAGGLAISEKATKQTQMTAQDLKYAGVMAGLGAVAGLTSAISPYIAGGAGKLASGVTGRVAGKFVSEAATKGATALVGKGTGIVAEGMFMGGSNGAASGAGLAYAEGKSAEEIRQSALMGGTSGAVMGGVGSVAGHFGSTVNQRTASLTSRFLGNKGSSLAGHAAGFASEGVALTAGQYGMNQLTGDSSSLASTGAEQVTSMMQGYLMSKMPRRNSSGSSHGTSEQSAERLPVEHETPASTRASANVSESTLQGTGESELAGKLPVTEEFSAVQHVSAEEPQSPLTRAVENEPAGKSAAEKADTKQRKSAGGTESSSQGTTDHELTGKTPETEEAGTKQRASAEEAEYSFPSTGKQVKEDANTKGHISTEETESSSPRMTENEQETAYQDDEDYSLGLFDTPTYRELFSGSSGKRSAQLGLAETLSMPSSLVQSRAKRNAQFDSGTHYSTSIGGGYSPDYEYAGSTTGSKNPFKSGSAPVNGREPIQSGRKTSDAPTEARASAGSERSKKGEGTSAEKTSKSESRGVNSKKATSSEGKPAEYAAANDGSSETYGSKDTKKPREFRTTNGHKVTLDSEPGEVTLGADDKQYKLTTESVSNDGHIHTVELPSGEKATITRDGNDVLTEWRGAKGEPMKEPSKDYSVTSTYSDLGEERGRRLRIDVAPTDPKGAQIAFKQNLTTGTNSQELNFRPSKNQSPVRGTKFMDESVRIGEDGQVRIAQASEHQLPRENPADPQRDMHLITNNDEIWAVGDPQYSRADLASAVDRVSHFRPNYTQEPTVGLHSRDPLNVPAQLGANGLPRGYSQKRDRIFEINNHQENVIGRVAQSDVADACGVLDQGGYTPTKHAAERISERLLGNAPTLLGNEPNPAGKTDGTRIGEKALHDIETGNPYIDDGGEATFTDPRTGKLVRREGLSIDSKPKGELVQIDPKTGIPDVERSKQTYHLGGDAQIISTVTRATGFSPNKRGWIPIIEKKKIN